MTDILAHHGILGQKWGVRRYQNEDGSLTPAGRKRYSQESARLEAREATARTPKDRLRYYDDVVRTASKFGADRKEIKNNPGNKTNEKLYNSLVKFGLGDNEHVSISSVRTYKISYIPGSEDGEYFYIDYDSIYGPICEYVDPEDDDSIEKGIKKLKLAMQAEAGDKNDKKAFKKLQDTRINAAKNFVNNLIFQAERKLTDIADAAGEVIKTAKDFVSNLLNVSTRSSVKNLNQRELEEYYVKKAYGVK